MAAPPPYDDGQKYNQGQAPPGYHPQQPGNYTQQPHVMNMVGVGIFGKDPITTTCPNCQDYLNSGQRCQQQTRKRS